MGKIRQQEQLLLSDAPGSSPAFQIQHGHTFQGLDRRAAAHTPLRHKRKGLIQLQAQKQKLSCQPQIRGSHCKA